MTDHPNPLWLKWLGHTLHGGTRADPPAPRPPRDQGEAQPPPTPDEIAAAVRDSGLPYGFPFTWM
jgi:hypothetical protein